MKGKTNNPNGRPKGAKNKAMTIKESFLLAFEGIGGVPKMVRWAKKNPTEFYRILGKMLPREVEISGRDGGPIEMKLSERLTKALERAGQAKS